jgi:hypothetical protein
MSYEQTMGMGETSEELRTVLSARGHAVRSKPECSPEQSGSMTILRQALDRAPSISDMPGSQEYQDTLRRTTYTYNETLRRCPPEVPAVPNVDMTMDNASYGMNPVAKGAIVIGILGLLGVGGYFAWRTWGAS